MLLSIASVFAVALADDPLYQAYRPPRQTRTQAAVIENISSFAKKHSEDARPWVRQYMGSETVRSRLHESLQHLTDEELLERFTWEFERLPIFHNGPSTALDLEEATIHDDSAMNVSVRDGYLQNPCIREVLGGNQARGYSYANFFEIFGMPDVAYANSHWPLRQADECFLFNANNLRKTSLGNVFFGGMTWVLNPKVLDKTLLFEVWDAGKTFSAMREVNVTFPGYGTRRDWYHLVQMHEALFNIPDNGPYNTSANSSDTCCNYSIADLFNRWWVPGTPPPTSGQLSTNPYYEIMVAGNVWLPEDLLYGIAKHSDVDYENAVRHMGQWGNAAGSELRAFLRQTGRPLLWADDDDSEMLIDPTVGHIAGGRITAADVAAWESSWQSLTDLAPVEQAARFSELVSSAPPHLKFRFSSWETRDACAQEELDPLKMVMGTDGNGDCVYWNASPPERWELLNDGSCETSDSVRAKFSSMAECVVAASQIRWGCATLPAAESATHVEVAYCVPDTTGNHTNRGSCEEVCFPRTSLVASDVFV
jgi:hypothetical protein